MNPGKEIKVFPAICVSYLNNKFIFSTALLFANIELIF